MLGVKSDNVDVAGSTFQQMLIKSKTWRIEDHYTNPGPIQFVKGKSIISNTMRDMYEKSDEIAD